MLCKINEKGNQTNNIKQHFSVITSIVQLYKIHIYDTGNSEFV